MGSFFAQRVKLEGGTTNVSVTLLFLLPLRSALNAPLWGKRKDGIPHLLFEPVLDVDVNGAGWGGMRVYRWWRRTRRCRGVRGASDARLSV